MKRSGIVILLSALFFLLVPVLTVSAAPKVVVDGQRLGFRVAPVVERGVVLVPVRGTFEALGATVAFTADTGTVTAVKGPTRVVLKPNSRMAHRNGQVVMLPAPPKLVRGTVLVPVRFVSESLGADVRWDPITRTVNIYTGPGLTVRAAPDFASTSVVRRVFTWRYGGRAHTCTLTLPAEAYRYYTGLARVPTNDLSVYVTDPDDDEYLAAVADQLRETADKAGYSPRQTVELAIAFVQSMEYVADDVSKGVPQYPRYPLETLGEGKGDCEDTSILLVSILQPLGYGAVLILIEDDPGHVAVGLKGRDLPGVYYAYGGDRYYYVETTGAHWGIGDVPPEFRHRSVRLLPLVPRPVIIHEWRYTITNGRLDLSVAVDNLGTGTAENTRVYAAFDAGDTMVYDQCRSESLDLAPRSRGTYRLRLQVPPTAPTRLLVRIISDGKVLDESRSEWFKR